MMDKIRIGEYLKKLRLDKKRGDGKSYSQNDLASDFMSIYDKTISINAIGEWESGVTLPSPENLEILSKIYEKTIDEILEGEDRKEIDYKAIYFLANENWSSNFGEKANLYQIRNEQILLIVSKFKELIYIRIERQFTSNEEDEFKFLFSNFYNISKYAYEISTLKVNDGYLIFKDALRKVLIEIKNMDIEEKYWEAQKLYEESSVLHFTFRLDVHDLCVVPILKERFNNLELWQKDMLLAMFQNIEPFDNNPTKYGSDYLKKYENENGEYDHETLIKCEIKELIEHGACINKCFLNIKKGYNEKKRIIDRLEELYNLCLKPIEIHISDFNGEKNEKSIKTYKIENSPKNRFLNEYYFSLKYALKKSENHNGLYSDVEEIYDWFTNNESISDNIYLAIAKKEKINVNQDKKYWMADLKMHSIIDKYFTEFKEKEKKIADGLKEIEYLKSKLINGEKEYSIHKYEIIGGEDENSIRSHIEFWKYNLDYSEFLRGREKKLTKELLNEIDKLSFSEIRTRYFKWEVIESE